MVSEDDDASTDRESSSCSWASARPTCWPTGTVPRVTDRKRRPSVHHLSSTTHCRSEPALLTNTCCCSEPALLTNTCCCYWPVFTSVVGEDDEPQGPRGQATDRWRWHLSSTTATDNSRRRSQRPHCWRAAGRWRWWRVRVTAGGHHRRLLSLKPIAEILSLNKFKLGWTDASFYLIFFFSEYYKLSEPETDTAAA